jgi:hypothetical protein
MGGTELTFASVFWSGSALMMGDDHPEEGEAVTTLTERPTEVGGLKQAVRGRRFLVIALVVLALAVVGLGTRVISDQATTGVDEEIQQLLDDYLTAWEVRDEAAVRSATTEDFVLKEYAYADSPFGVSYRVDDDINGLVNVGFGYVWTNEQVGDPIVTGEGPWFVSVEEIWEGSARYLEGQATYTIVEVDGVLKIAYHYWAGLESFSTGISDQATTGLDEEIQQLLDNYLTAREVRDEAAVRSATTEGFVLNEYAYRDDIVGFRLSFANKANIDRLVREGFGYNWTNEQVGDPIVTGEGPWFVSVEEIWETPVTHLEGQSNYTIVEVDGVFKIANHYWAGLESYPTG